VTCRCLELAHTKIRASFFWLISCAPAPARLRARQRGLGGATNRHHQRCASELSLTLTFALARCTCLPNWAPERLEHRRHSGRVLLTLLIRDSGQPISFA
jgi:hypothetical protein